MPNEGPAHNVASEQEEKKLFFVLCLTAFIMLVEIVGGYVSGSLALLADAGHMFTDVAALALSWAAARYGRKAPDDRRTFGYQRLKILAAYTNGILLFFLCGIIVVEAAHRLAEPKPVDGPLMFGIALVGLVTNLVSYRILRGSHVHHHGHDHQHHTASTRDLNVHSATLHVLGDMFGSAGALLAAIIVMATGWSQADPILSLIVSGMILFYAVGLVRKTTQILIEGAPDPTLPGRIRDTVMGIEGVIDVHHVHVWSLTEKQPLATMDVTVQDHMDGQAMLPVIRGLLEERLGLDHVTIQIERGQIEKGVCQKVKC